jgi:sRNA-binding carbon storage regulator CsrA
MLVVSRKPDETVQVGDDLQVTVTDVDEAGVRLHVRGRCIGGACDGEFINRAFELGSRGEVQIGDLVHVTVARMSCTEERAYLAFVTPPNISVHRKEIYDALKRKREARE